MRHPETYNGIVDALARHDIPHRSLNSGDNIWMRDFMPIRAGEDLFRFRYDAYGYRRRPSLKVPITCQSQFTGHASSIFLDGGNVEIGEEKMLMCDMVFRKNPSMTKIELTEELELLFEKEIVFLPCEPGDSLGHVDGIARFSGTATVLINNYSCRNSRQLNSYQLKLERVLERAGLDPIPITYAYDQCPKMTLRQFRKKYPFGDDLNPAIGYYINFLHIESLILVPVFGLLKDELALIEMEEAFPNCRVIGVPCFDVGMQGGAINCVTWVN